MFPKFNVADSLRCRFYAQAWDVEDLPEQHRVIFEDMLDQGHTVRIVDTLVYLIR
jgi:hypoxanthine-guanine phosphoribosyltransferase